MLSLGLVAAAASPIRTADPVATPVIRTMIRFRSARQLDMDGRNGPLSVPRVLVYPTSSGVRPVQLAEVARHLNVVLDISAVRHEGVLAHHQERQLAGRQPGRPPGTPTPW